jgi:hypothetical protein
VDMIDRLNYVEVDVFCGWANTCSATGIGSWKKNVYRTTAMHILEYL